MSNLELWRYYNVLSSEPELPSASTFRKICQRDYSLTVDAIKQQFPSRNEVSLDLDGWSSTNKFAIRSVIAGNINLDWTF